MKAKEKQIGGSHYKALDVEPWDAMLSWLEIDGFEAYLRGNAIKYLARAGKKGSAEEDYRKALHYLERLLELYD